MTFAQLLNFYPDSCLYFYCGFCCSNKCVAAAALAPEVVAAASLAPEVAAAAEIATAATTAFIVTAGTGVAAAAPTS